MENFCKNCGNPIKEGAKFCLACGSPIEQPVTETPTCAYCGAKMKPTSKFCPTCGKPTAAGQTAARYTAPMGMRP